MRHSTRTCQEGLDVIIKNTFCHASRNFALNNALLARKLPLCYLVPLILSIVNHTDTHKNMNLLRSKGVLLMQKLPQNRRVCIRKSKGSKTALAAICRYGPFKWSQFKSDACIKLSSSFIFQRNLKSSSLFKF